MAIAKIILPTDFSIESDYALQLADLISRENKSEVCLMHVDSVNYQMNQSELETLRKNSIERLDRIATNEQFDNIQLWIKEQFVFNDENVADAIERVAVHEDFDLIITSSKYQKSEPSALSKSITVELLEKATVPLIVTGELNSGYKLNKVLYVSDFKDQTLKTDLLMTLAQSSHRKFTLLNIHLEKISESNEAASIQLMKKFASKFRLKNSEHVNVNSDSLLHGIINYQESKPVDIIALDYSLLIDLENEKVVSIINNLIEECGVPILVLK